MKSAERFHSPGGQCGAATLVITVLLLFSMSLMTLYSARVGVVEQRLAANDVQTRTAFAAAQAGLDRTLAGLATLDRTDIAYDSDGWAVVASRAATLPNDADYSAEAHNRGLIPFRADVLRLESSGTSGDGSSSRALMLVAAFTSLVPNIPPAALELRGNLSTGAGLQLDNAERPVAAWLGGTYTPAAAPPDTLLSEPAWCPPLGICEADDRIGLLTPEAFFENVFGRPPLALRSTARVLRCASCVPAAVPSDREVIWLENAGATVSLAAGQLGTEEHPVVVVIDGDFEPVGSIHIYGLLFVLGDWLAGDGTLVTEGAVVVAGNAVDVGPAQLHYHAGILNTLHETGRYSAIPGSWTDF